MPVMKHSCALWSTRATLLLKPRTQGELEAFVRKGEAGDRQQVAVQIARRV